MKILYISESYNTARKAFKDALVRKVNVTRISHIDMTVEFGDTQVKFLGIDRPENLRGTRYDLIVVSEKINLTENQHEMLRVASV